MTTLDGRAVENRLVAGQWLGVAGAGLIALGGAFAGVGPANDTTQIPDSAGAVVLWPSAIVYLGLTLLLLGWYELRDAPARELIRAGVMWAVPFLLSGPIFSRDVYSYLAQGAMTVAGVDPYAFGPSALGGELTINVPPIWQDTPAPYGPVFLTLAGGITTITQQELWPGLVGMRLLAVAGIALMVPAVRRIARECGVQPDAALWLGVLNPLVLLHLVADAHNEAVMLGLMCAGLALGLSRRPLLGAVLITLAGLVKGPALLALVFLAAHWALRLPGRTRWVRAGAATAGVAAVTAAVVTALAGTGFGWIPALRTPTLARTWMSVTTDIGSLLGPVLDSFGVATVGETRHAVWLAGLVAAGLATLGLLRLSTVRQAADRLGLVPAVGLGLTALVVLSPVVHVWYLLWGLAPLAAAGSPRVRRITVYVTPALVLLAPPNGVAPGFQLVLGAVLGVVAGLWAYAMVQVRSAEPAW